MKPIKHKYCNGTAIARDNLELSLPMAHYKANDGLTVTCWQVSLLNRLKLLLTGKIWISTKTFGQDPHPIIVEADCPYGNWIEIEE